MCRLYFLCLIALSSFCNAQNNIVQQQLSRCKEHNVEDSFYGYTDFFEISTFQNNIRAHDEILHLKFAVSVRESAYILLSETESPGLKDWIYEFALGEWNNTFTAYRLQLSGPWVSRAETIDLLDEYDSVPFEIVQRNEGTIRLGIPGRKMLLYYFDKTPLNINYVSFSAGDYAGDARWNYDCQFNEKVWVETKQKKQEDKKNQGEENTQQNNTINYYYFIYNNNNP